MNSIVKNIPNIITACNLISGCIAVINALQGNIEYSLIWIIIGATFDFFDGLTARALHVSSPIGKELDSLADVVTFGVAPSVTLYYVLSIAAFPRSFYATLPFSEISWVTIVPYLAFIMAAFSAFRLAKFNLDTRQSTSFIGLPTPANALFWGSLLLTNFHWIGMSSLSPFVLLLLMGLSSFLLISELPMFSLKFKHWNWRGNEIRYAFIIVTCIALSLFGLLKGWWIAIGLYFIISLIAAFRQPKTPVDTHKHKDISL